MISISCWISRLHNHQLDPQPVLWLQHNKSNLQEIRSGWAHQYVNYGISKIWIPDFTGVFFTGGYAVTMMKINCLLQILVLMLHMVTVCDSCTYPVPSGSSSATAVANLISNRTVWYDTSRCFNSLMELPKLIAVPWQRQSVRCAVRFVLKWHNSFP